MAGKKTILIIDDDVALLKMAEELLRGQYDVSLAKSGRQALRLLQRKFLPDAILLDIDMPYMDGFETMAALRELPQLEDVPVIFLTGLTEAESEQLGLRSGAWDYITKPFDREVLRLRLELQIRNGEQRRSARALRQASQSAPVDEEKFTRLAAGLTHTERKIARLIAQGYSNREVGETLHYSYSYVKKVTCVIFDKLHIQKRGELRKLVQ